MASGLPDELVAQALSEARGHLAELDGRIAELARTRETARREVELLEQLLAVRQGEQEPPPRTSKASATPRKSRPDTSRVVEQVVVDLERAGKPLHISELMGLLQEREIPVPGAGQQANLIALLTRDDRIVRPSRGMYALAAAGFEDRPKLKPAVRRRARGKSRTRNQEREN